MKQWDRGNSSRESLWMKAPSAQHDLGHLQLQSNTLSTSMAIRIITGSGAEKNLMFLLQHENSSREF